MQEIALAKKVTIYLGPISIPWDGVLLTCKYSWEGSDALIMLNGTFFSHMLASEALQDTSASTSNRIARFLRVTMEKEVSDPKDKVYAVSGLLQALGLHLPPPDYSKPIAD